ncbi:MAG: c-type cytochrome biogenesis protein CcmI [Rhodobacteraceae bacterium]|nr:c-type cytochrome biogenesis protein CcmI [Paracoccaceae bacterium]
MLFWGLVGFLALGTGAVLALVILRGRIGDEPPAAYDLRVYRDQLNEVDRDLARGIISGEDAERTRAEVSRRILIADALLEKDSERGAQPVLTGRIAALLAFVALGAGSFFVYDRLGAPGYRDVPLQARIAAAETRRANLPTQEALEARMPEPEVPDGVQEDYLVLMTQLRGAVAERPGDLRGLQLLARNEAALGNMVAARKAQEQIIKVKADAATAEDHAQLADMMVTAAGGQVSAEAEAVLRQVLARDPKEPRARYYLGLHFMQVDRPDMAFRLWDELLRESTADAPWTPLIRARIEELAWRAGVQRYELPPESGAPAAPGPSLADIDAAGDMSPEDRAAMIEGMVAQLSARIEAEGGSAGEWARLVNAYAVLGQADKARAAMTEARGIFADDPMALSLITNAAKQAGLAE